MAISFTGSLIDYFSIKTVLTLDLLDGLVKLMLFYHLLSNTENRIYTIPCASGIG